MKKFVLLPLISLAFFCNLYAQNYLLENNQSGIVIQGSYSDNEGSALYGIIPSLNFYGRTSIGVGLQRFNSPEVSGFKTTPYVSHLFLKKTKETGITNLGLGAYYTFENDDEETVNIEAYGIGPEFSYQFILGDYQKIGFKTGIYFGSLITESVDLSINYTHKKLFIEFLCAIANFSQGDFEDSSKSIGFSLGYLLF